MTAFNADDDDATIPVKDVNGVVKHQITTAELLGTLSSEQDIVSEATDWLDKLRQAGDNLEQYWQEFKEMILISNSAATSIVQNASYEEIYTGRTLGDEILASLTLIRLLDAPSAIFGAVMWSVRTILSAGYMFARGIVNLAYKLEKFIFPSVYSGDTSKV